MTFLDAEDDSSHKASFYAYENRLAISAEDSIEFDFSIVDDLLIIESIDKQFRYSLKRK
jgi:hypothetical protein